MYGTHQQKQQRIIEELEDELAAVEGNKMNVTFQSMDNAPQDGSILLTNEGCCYWSEDYNQWRLCSPTWRNGKPEHFEYSCADNGAYDVDPVFWAKHPHDETQQ